MIDRVSSQSLDQLQESSVASHLRRSAISTPNLRNRIGALVGQELSQVESLIESTVVSRFADVHRLSSHAASMGGKRLRPLLVLLAAKATGDTPSRRAQSDLQRVACAVELVHTASLVHDDVMDDASHRRHLPTVARLAGSSSAILLGDYLFTKAYHLAAQCRSNVPARQIARASTSLCEGELRQQMAAGNWDLSLKNYRGILAQKTAALCATSCRLGAWAAGGKTEPQRALEAYGQNLGLAFQLFDDWLDYWGSEATGKTLGTDFRQGKPTLPVLRLLAQTPTAKRHELLQLLSSEQADAFALIREALDRSDASEYTLRIAQKCVDRALKSLRVVSETESTNCLADIARFSIARVA